MAEKGRNTSPKNYDRWENTCIKLISNKPKQAKKKVKKGK